MLNTLRQNTIFRALTIEEIEGLSERIREENYKAGSVE
jgi:hypothetical protein